MQDLELGFSSKGKTVVAMNITDVDDKLIKTSIKTSIPVKALSKRYEADFLRSLSDLNCLKPDIILRVSESIQSDIIPYIQKMVDNRSAYYVEGEGVYMDVSGLEKTGLTKYGKLSGGTGGAQDDNSSFETLFEWQPEEEETDDATTTFDKSTSKRKSSRDFSLWKDTSKREPTDQNYDSPWGRGRPGWHIECTAMIEGFEKKLSGDRKIGFHGGGVDLKFPHHSNEIFQAEGYHLMGKSQSSSSSPNRISLDGEWIDNWVHPGHLYIKGCKMSKSLKNFVTVDELLDPQVSILSSPAGIGGLNNHEELTKGDIGDIFRLWVLGYSGKLSGNANWRAERMEECKLVRGRVVKALKEIEAGERWSTRDHGDRVQLSSRKEIKGWGSLEVNLFNDLEATRREVGDILHSRNNYDNRTLESSPMIKALVNLVSKSDEYMRAKEDINEEWRGSEVLNVCSREVASSLSSLGFSSGMTDAQLMLVKEDQMQKGSVGSTEDEIEKKINDLKVVLQCLKGFRSAVREVCLKGVKASKKDEHFNAEGEKELLSICDKLRKELGGLGIDCSDEKVEVNKEHIKTSFLDQIVKEQKGWDDRRRVAISGREFIKHGGNKGKNKKQGGGEKPAAPAWTGDINEPEQHTFPRPCGSGWSRGLSDDNKPQPKFLFKKHPLFLGVFGSYDGTGVPTCYPDGKDMNEEEVETLRGMKDDYVKWFYFGNEGTDYSKDNGKASFMDE